MTQRALARSAQLSLLVLLVAVLSGSSSDSSDVSLKLKCAAVATRP